MTETYRLVWIDGDGSRQSPGLDDGADIFPSEGEAWAAARDLIDSDPETWADADFQVEET